VDASFAEERRRCRFADLAARLRLPAVFLYCQADPGVIRLRLRDRLGDPSDADWRIYEQSAKRWEEPGPFTQWITRPVHSGGVEEQTFSQVRAVLHDASLMD
jgi:predicted kinase